MTVDRSNSKFLVIHENNRDQPRLRIDW